MSSVSFSPVVSIYREINGRARAVPPEENKQALQHIDCPICQEAIAEPKKGEDMLHIFGHDGHHDETKVFGPDDERLCHLFHKHCIKEWIDTSEAPFCPMCKAEVGVLKIRSIEIGDESSTASSVSQTGDRVVIDVSEDESSESEESRSMRAESSDNSSLSEQQLEEAAGARRAILRGASMCAEAAKVTCRCLFLLFGLSVPAAVIWTIVDSVEHHR